MKRRNLEEFIRGKVEQGSFPYREGAWEQAAEQFAAWDAARKRRRRWFLILLPLMAGLSFMGWQMWSGATQDTFSQANAAYSAIIPHTLSTPYYSSDFDSSQMASATPHSASQHSTVLNIQTSVRKPSGNIISSAQESRPEVAWDEEAGMADFSPLEGMNKTPESLEFTQEKQTMLISKIAFQDTFTIDNRVIPQFFPESKPPFKRLSLYLEAGFSSFRGFGSEIITNPSLAASPILGAGITYSLRRNLRLKAGLQYAGRTGLNHALTGEEITYDFVRQDKKITWTPERLHFLYLPLEIQRRTFANQRLLLGGQIGYLLGTEGTLVTQGSSFYEPSQSPVTSKAPAYVTGISIWDVNLHAGYELRLAPRWGAALRYHLGLMDLLKDESFRSSGINRNSHLSFRMTYNF